MTHWDEDAIRRERIRLRKPLEPPHDDGPELGFLIVVVLGLALMLLRVLTGAG